MFDSSYACPLGQWVLRASASVPCRRRSEALALLVSHLRLPTLLLVGSPSLWQVSMPSGTGPTNTVITRRWTKKRFVIPSRQRVTRRWPESVTPGDSTRPHARFPPAVEPVNGPNASEIGDLVALVTGDRTPALDLVAAWLDRLTEIHWEESPSSEVGRFAGCFPSRWSTSLPRTHVCRPFR